MELETYSANGGQTILSEKGVLENLHELPAIWAEYSGQRQYDSRSEALKEAGGWETEVQIDLGPESRPHAERLTPFLDAYHPDYAVAIEHERKEQMRARWHLLKIQAAAEREQARAIDVGVLIIPAGNNPSLQRTQRELTGPFFTEHFQIELPLYIIEYSFQDNS